MLGTTDPILECTSDIKNTNCKFYTYEDFDIPAIEAENTFTILGKIQKNLKSFNKLKSGNGSKKTRFESSVADIEDLPRTVSQYIDNQVVVMDGKPDSQMETPDTDEDPMKLYKSVIIEEIKNIKQKKVDIIKPIDDGELLEQCRAVSEGYRVAISADYSVWKPHPRFDKNVEQFIFKRKHKNGTIFAVAKEEFEEKQKKCMKPVQTKIASKIPEPELDDASIKARNQKRKRGPKKKKQKQPEAPIDELSE